MLTCASNAEGATGLPFLTCSNIGKTVNNQTPLLAFHWNAQPDQMRFDPYLSATLTRSQEAGAMVVDRVRRLTPVECERLQGFPGTWTMIPWRGKPAEQCPDGPRYKALGNSKAVPVVRWIGARLKAALLPEITC